MFAFDTVGLCGKQVDVDVDDDNTAAGGPWSRLGIIVLVAGIAGVLAAWALPLVLSNVAWPQIVSEKWVDRLAHSPEPVSEPPAPIDEAAIQPIALPTPPTPEEQPAGETDDEPAEPQPAPRPRSEATARDKPPEPESAQEDSPADEPTDVTYRVDRRAISRIIRTPGDLGKHGHFVPNSVDGQRRGFKFVDVTSGGLFDRLGIRRGDIVLEVNGRTLTTQSKLIEDVQKLKSDHIYVVRIQREDGMRIHRYDAGPPLQKREPAEDSAEDK